jgi:signal transduction histidine kinase
MRRRAEQLGGRVEMLRRDALTQVVLLLPIERRQAPRANKD